MLLNKKIFHLKLQLDMHNEENIQLMISIQDEVKLELMLMELWRLMMVEIFDYGFQIRIDP